MKHLLAALIVMASITIFTGCGESPRKGSDSGIDLNTPVARLEEEASNMGLSELKGKAAAYQAAVTEKSKELLASEKELKDLPLSEMIGEKADTLKTKVSKVGEELKQLKQRLGIYEAQITKKSAQ